MVSLSQVWVKNAKSGLQSRITDRTSSIFGAIDMVLASRRLTPCSWTSDGLDNTFSAGSLEMTRARAVLEHAGLLNRTREWLRDWITGMKRLFWLPQTKVSIWIFNVIAEGICKFPSSWPQFASREIGFPSEKFPRQGSRWSVPWHSNRFLRSFFRPPRQLRCVGLTQVMLRVVKRHHRTEASFVLQLGAENKKELV